MPHPVCCHPLCIKQARNNKLVTSRNCSYYNEDCKKRTHYLCSDHLNAGIINRYLSIYLYYFMSFNIPFNCNFNFNISHYVSKNTVCKGYTPIL